MEEKSKPTRIENELIDRAKALAIRATAERNELLKLYDVIQEAVRLGLDQIERDLDNADKS